MAQTAILGAGVMGETLLSGLVRAFLFETAPTDLHAYAASAGVLIAAGLLAALAPALRAARVDPIIALRSE